ncbi:dihydrodipicolinate synthase family protein [Solirubrobacter soli]|uniref:dihydrodipicolinate synthase family protein n=1 Tax=Solirubrobacter soli TaxID=363832 RepID=UPI0003F7E8B6|nr:dihydrodipicolinate synthase family protein [Solirubrobacter soli]
MASSFEGVYAAALTPLREDLTIDRRAYAAHCRRLLDEGCDGLAIFGTTGEANSFSVGERVSAWQDLVADGIPPETLLPGTGACALTDAVTLTREALAAGAPGVLALPPFYYKGVSDDGLFAFFAELIERVADDRLRLFLYHIPPQTILGFSFALIARLLDAYPGVIAGTKDSSGDAARIEAVCKEFPQLRVFAGTESLLLDTLRWGGAGCISATVNVTAPLSAEVFRTRDDAAQARLTARREHLERFPVIPALKAIMRHRTGEDTWHVRPPLVGLDDDRARELLAGL